MKKTTVLLLVATLFTVFGCRNVSEEGSGARNAPPPPPPKSAPTRTK